MAKMVDGRMLKKDAWYTQRSYIGQDIAAGCKVLPA